MYYYVSQVVAYLWFLSKANQITVTCDTLLPCLALLSKANQIIFTWKAEQSTAQQIKADKKERLLRVRPCLFCFASSAQNSRAYQSTANHGKAPLHVTPDCFV